MRRYRELLIGLLVAGVLTVPPSVSAESSPAFEDRTAESGIQHTGASWGASWGDFDGDGRADLWVSNHGGTPGLYLNLGDGQFQNITSQTVAGLTGDQHGAMWADFDNDGDQDLIQLVGAGSGIASGPNRLYVNDGGMLTDRASELGVDYPLGRGRTPVWFDWNRDGKLDVFVLNSARPDGQAPSALFTQDAGGFVDSTESTGLVAGGDGRIARITRLPAIDPTRARPRGGGGSSRLHGNSVPVILTGNGSAFPEHAYRYDRLPFEDMAEDSAFPPNLWGGQDAAIADFDGDLWPDMFLVRQRDASSVVELASDTLRASIIVNGDEKGFVFRATAAVRFRVEPPWHFTTSDIYIGAAGVHPQQRLFTLEANEASGESAHSPGVDFGVFISHDTDTGLWKVLFSNSSWRRLDLVIDTEGSISDLATLGFDSSEGELPDQLLLSSVSYQQAATGMDDLAVPSACVSAVAADFDNDMDVDLYLVCSGKLSNSDNLLFVNDGRGGFRRIESAMSGAAGSEAGRGDSVTTVDYDGDGFMDLFVTNGLGNPPFNDGPYQLFRNRGNDNNWLEIDLEGVVSNRDGIGAQILVTAGGVTQLRQQTGGGHARSQDHSRIHFGLGNHSRVSRLTVEWPSGIRQEISNLAANQLVHVIEPSLPSPLGRPSYQAGQDVGVFLWREAVHGTYHLRVSGDELEREFVIEVISASPLVDVRPVALEGAQDELDSAPNYLRLTSRVQADEDGVDFDIPTGKSALLFVEQDGVANPRQVRVGAAARPISPGGWILNMDELPALPGFSPGRDLGLFIGSGTGLESSVVARLNGDGRPHRMSLRLLVEQRHAPESIERVTPELDEVGDSLHVTATALTLDASVQDWWDGFEAYIPLSARIALLFTQDGMFQPDRVNPHASGLGPPNAYLLREGLPAAEPRTPAVGPPAAYDDNPRNSETAAR